MHDYAVISLKTKAILPPLKKNKEFMYLAIYYIGSVNNRSKGQKTDDTLLMKLKIMWG